MVATHTRVSERLTMALQGANRDGHPEHPVADEPAELKELREDFGAFQKQFKPFRAVLKKYHASLVRLEKDRKEMMEQLESWTKDTPLEGLVVEGGVQANGNNEPTLPKSLGQKPWAVDASHSMDSADQSAISSHGGSSIHSDAFSPAPVTPLSLSAIYQRISTSNQVYAQHLAQYALEYVAEWDMVVSTRVRSALKATDDAKHNWTHYQLKVNSLANTHSKLEKRGRTVDARSHDKVTRNKEKLELADKEYRIQVTKACTLLRACLDCAWKDVHPLVYRLANMERDRLLAQAGGGSQDNTSLARALEAIVGQLQLLARDHDIDTSLPTASSNISPPASPRRDLNNSLLTNPNDQGMLSSGGRSGASSSSSSYASSHSSHSNRRGGRPNGAPSDESSHEGANRNSKYNNNKYHEKDVEYSPSEWDDVRDVLEGAERVRDTRIVVSSYSSETEKV